MTKVTSAVRRRFKAHGFVVRASRRRRPDDYRVGGYMILDAETNFIIWGGGGLEYTLTAEDVVEIAGELN